MDLKKEFIKNELQQLNYKYTSFFFYNPLIF